MTIVFSKRQKVKKDKTVVFYDASVGFIKVVTNIIYRFKLKPLGSTLVTFIRINKNLFISEKVFITDESVGHFMIKLDGELVEHQPIEVPVRVEPAVNNKKFCNLERCLYEKEDLEMHI